MHYNQCQPVISPIPYLQNNFTHLLQYYAYLHSKTFLVRADVRYPVDYPFVADNFHIQRCMAKVIQYLQRHGYQPMYIWVREQNTSIHPHYHCVFLLNGQKTRSARLVFDTLARFWASTIGYEAPGLIHHCEIIVDDNPFQYGQMLYRSEGIPANVYGMIDYLAKDYSKGERKDGLRDFGMSRTPPDWQPQPQTEEGTSDE